MHIRILTFMLVGVFLWGNIAFAQMTSSNFEIRWDSVNTGGSDSSASGSYLLRSTISSSPTGSGISDGGTYQLRSGYRHGVYDEVIEFEVFAQSGTYASATALSSTTVTADSSSFSTGDYVALIQDLGASQVVAVGKIASTTVSTLTVDVWKDNGTSPTIDGTDDYLYLLSGTSSSFDDLSDEEVKTLVVGFEVSAENGNGYIVQVLESQDPTSGADTLDDVADGAVSSGTEEYGARSSDTSITGSTFDTEDTAFSTSFQTIASESTSVLESRNFLTVKAAIDSETETGTYTHDLSFIVSGNF